ncbi:hypothetical protein BDZ97DRAFT_1753335 [Flammula alnicola]|nr:hypothetical protein BDZ97DRAFT_1753335 [Flammula alnicola]
MPATYPITPKESDSTQQTSIHGTSGHVDVEARSTSDELEHRRLAEVISSTISKRTPHFDLPSISPLSNVRMSEYATTVNVPRHQSSSAFQPYSDYSPYSSAPPTAVNSRAPSPTKELDDYDEDFIDNHDRLKWRLASGFFACFMGGWADGVTGTVMPYLAAQFHMTSTLSSSLFAGTTCGFFAGTFLVESIMKYLGTFRVHRNEAFDDDFGHSTTQARFLVLVMASIMHSTYFIMMGSRSGFPVMFLAYVMSAFSRALLTAPLNAYFAEGPKQALGYGLGLASLGSVISPLVCQSIIATGVPWYRFYYGSLVLSGCNIVFVAITFRPTSSETFKERQKALNEGRRRKSEFLRSCRSSPVNDTESPGVSTIKFNVENKSRSSLRLALTMAYQWAFSFFMLLYCGSETVTQGFMVTYLLSTRVRSFKCTCKPKDYRLCYFWVWGGISLGRFIWGYCIPLLKNTESDVPAHSLTFTQRKYAVHACM